MESRIITPGPYRATKLWNEVTKYFRAGMPLKRHRIHFKTYGNCFTSSEAIDWLHQLLRNNSNFGTEVTRQQTIQLLRKFLKNHVIEDLKGRWGTEDLEDNHNLYRFPSTSPVKTIPNRQPLWKRSSLENVFKEKDNMFKMPHFSKKTPKRHNSLDSQGQQENEEMEIMEEDQGCDESGPQELTQKDVEDIWGNITLNHLQKILALPSLEEVLNPAQINPAHIMYNMTHTSKHGVVFLQDKTDDLPHWVLSAMKCLANWPRNNDLSQPTYPGFEGDVFRTVADYFLNLPGPLLTYEYYELFVNILVVCGYITVPRRRTTKRKPKKGTSRQQPSKPLQSGDTNFKSTECLLLSLLRKVPNEEEQDDVDTFGEIGRQRDFDLKNSQRAPLHGTVDGQSTGGSRVIGGSCQNLSVSGRGGSGPYRVRVRSCSLEGIADVSGSSNDGSIADSSSSKPCSPNLPSEDHSALLGGNAFSLSSGGQPQTLQLWPDVHRYAPFHDSRRLPRSQSLGLLQPHLQRVAIDALQVCCLLLPPPNRRKLQLLMRMISRMSQNVDMPRLHDAMGTRSLMIQTFSRCVLCCAEEVDLDELLATRLVSFLMDHHQEVLQVPCYLQTAVQEHIHYLQRPRVKGQPPGFYFCKQISAQEFEEQKVVMSQVAIMDLLESIVKDKNISVKDKKKKLKQFQKEYPEIYKSRFPTTESEAKLFGDKPTIKQPMLVLKRPKFRNLRH
ncbi:DEP domain-containing protein 1A isoform X2 [Rana temporaria]|uniref:DEP domain-containing protein 1A isoform X2 n=1 Tax=Rana temporaria TaxID=8407 RepID=UPI001AADFC0E|nr:DEP domain-containing protein 1A isoform X2 [Rana temporaria]